METDLKPNANAEGAPPSNDALSDLKSTNERLLAESKKYKSEYQKLKVEREELEAKKLEEQGKEAERAKHWESKYKELNERVLKKSVDDAIMSYAKEKGCIDPKAVVRLGNMSQVVYDEETGEVSGVDIMLEDLKKNSPYLFAAPKSPVINSTTPGVRVTSDVDRSKNFGKLSQAERNKLLSEAFSKKR